MPIQEFRTIEEMNAADEERRRLSCDDPALPERIRRHWASWRFLPSLEAPRGVRKFRSIEEANAYRDALEQARIARIRAEHKQKK